MVFPARPGVALRIGLALLVAGTALALLRGCGPAASSAATIVDGLCDGRAELREGGVARDIYVERVHEPIHDLEDRARAEDEVAAARLAEANEWLETALDGHADDIDGALAAVIIEVGRTAAALSEGEPGGCD